MLISVIIPTLGRYTELAGCLDRLAPGAQTLPADHYEVIVTDDVRGAAAGPLIKNGYPWAKWCAGPGRGLAANRNNGARIAGGEWLVFTDDDCRPPGGWLKAYAEAFAANSDCQVVYGGVYTDRPRRSLAETAPTYRRWSRLFVGCNFAIRKELYSAMGGHDEGFPYCWMEDVELNVRLEKSGVKKLFVESASTCHPWRLYGGHEESRRQREGMLFFLKRHPDQKKTVNPAYFIGLSIKTMLSDTIPGFFIFRGRGVSSALVWHFECWKNAYLLFRDYYKR